MRTRVPKGYRTSALCKTLLRSVSQSLYEGRDKGAAASYSPQSTIYKPRRASRAFRPRRRYGVPHLELEAPTGPFTSHESSA